MKILTVVAVLTAWLTAGPAFAAGAAQEAKIAALESRVKQLEDRVAQLEGSASKADAGTAVDSRRANLRELFVARIEQDRSTYSDDELREIERLYQIANREWNSPEAKESLKTLIGKYSKANRTGCAVLYLGQMSSGEEKENYLKRAIAEFGDCRYGNGVQVGAYARFHLAHYYQKTGKADEAAALFKEIREQFPDAVDHKGRLLADIMPK